MDLAVFAAGTLAAAVLLFTVLEVLSPRKRARQRAGRAKPRMGMSGGTLAAPAVGATSERGADRPPPNASHHLEAGDGTPSPLATPAPSEDIESVPDRCREFLAADRVEDALAEAIGGLSASPPGATTTRAELWRLVAEARSRLGDREGAHAAWQGALAAAPADERDAYGRQFVAFATHTVRRMMTESRLVGDSATRLAHFRTARTLLAAARREHVETLAVEELDAVVAEAIAHLRAAAGRDPLGAPPA